MVQNNPSSTAPLDFGLPQGSVQGPVLFILYTMPLSFIIEKHSVNHEMFADGTLLCKSVPPNDYDSMVLFLQKCTANIKNWMLENKLKLNDEKTEAICFSPPSFGLAYSLSDSISLGSCNIQFTRKVRDLGFWLDSDLTTKQYVIKICQSAYLELICISCIHQYLTTPKGDRGCLMSTLTPPPPHRCLES